MAAMKMLSMSEGLASEFDEFREHPDNPEHETLFAQVELVATGCGTTEYEMPADVAPRVVGLFRRHLDAALILGLRDVEVDEGGTITGA
jgi:hypothetical protein